MMFNQFISLVSVLIISQSDAFGSEFGSDGRQGTNGYDGRSGRSGASTVIQAVGAGGHYEISGEDGGNGGIGENGFRATGCVQPNRPSYNVNGASGGSGGSGGDGGNGGHGGALTAHFQEIAHLKSIYVHGTPGRGGQAAWGGRGGDGCRCSLDSWTIPGTEGQTSTYRCADGQPGRDASSGRTGANGGYGRVTLIPQMEPVKPEASSILISMTKMEEGPFTVSKNLWEIKRGARALFASGSDLADSYYYYAGRVESTVRFRWDATRPLSDFANWQMRLELNGTEPVVRFPAGAWVDAKMEGEGYAKTYVIKAIVTSNEIGSFQFDQFGGDGETHVISIKDHGGMADVLHNSIHMQYFVAVAGQYQKKMDAVLPPEALSTGPNSIQVKMAKTGLDPALFKIGTQAYVNFLVTRSLGDDRFTYQLASYYTIKLTLNIGDAVEAIEDSSLMSGNQVIGHVTKGDKFLVNKIQGEWISLKTLDGTAVQGWVVRPAWSITNW